MTSPARTLTGAALLAAGCTAGAWLGYRAAREFRDFLDRIGDVGDYPCDEAEALGEVSMRARQWAQLRLSTSTDGGPVP